MKRFVLYQKKKGSDSFLVDVYEKVNGTYEHLKEIRGKNTRELVSKTLGKNIFLEEGDEVRTLDKSLTALVDDLTVAIKRRQVNAYRRILSGYQEN